MDNQLRGNFERALTVPNQISTGCLSDDCNGTKISDLPSPFSGGVPEVVQRNDFVASSACMFCGLFADQCCCVDRGHDSFSKRVRVIDSFQVRHFDDARVASVDEILDIEDICGPYDEWNVSGKVPHVSCGVDPFPILKNEVITLTPAVLQKFALAGVVWDHSIKVHSVKAVNGFYYTRVASPYSIFDVAYREEFPLASSACITYVLIVARAWNEALDNKKVSDPKNFDDSEDVMLLGSSEEEDVPMDYRIVERKGRRLMYTSVKNDKIVVSDAPIDRRPMRQFHFPTQRELDRVDLKEFVSRDGNSLLNDRVWTRLANNSAGEFKVHGYTQLGPYRFNFPVFCSARTFKRSLSVIEQMPPFVRRRLCLDGIIDAETYRHLSFLFEVRQRAIERNELVVLRGDFGFVVLSLMSTALLVHFERHGKRWSKCERWLFNIMNALFLFFVFLSDFVPEWLCYEYFSVMQVAAEEIFKELFGPLWLIVPEVYIKLIGFVYNARSVDIPYFYIIGALPDIFVHCTFAVIMHCFVGLMPFWMRIPVHFSYNYAVGAYFQNCRFMLGQVPLGSFESALKSCEDLAWVVDCLRKIYLRDSLGVALSMGMKASNLMALVRMLDLPDAMALDELLEEETYPGAVADELEAEVVLLGAEERSKLSALADHFLPSFMSKSPLVKKTCALTLLFISSGFGSELSVVKAVSNHVSWDSVLTVGSAFDISMSAFKAVVAAIGRIGEGASFKEVWGLPEEVEFVRGSLALLNDSRATDSHDEVMLKMARTRSLIDSRTYKLNDANVNRLIDRLHAYCAEKMKFLDSSKMRKMPMPIWIMGDPGVGKTIVMKCLINMLRKKDGVEHFEGDTINYNVQDKFPASSGAHPLARFLVMNDIPAEYNEAAKEDRLGLDLALQQMIDTFPYEIRAAAVEKKGQVFNDIKYVLISSNHTKYSFGGETEKLERRLSGGVLVRAFFEKDGKVLKYADTVDMSQAQRNAVTKFRVCKVNCSSKQMYFTDTQVVYSMLDFAEYVTERSIAHDARMDVEFAKFSDPANTCDCGLPTAYHKVVHDRLGEAHALRSVCCFDFAKRNQIDRLVWTLKMEACVEKPDLGSLNTSVCLGVEQVAVSLMYGTLWSVIVGFIMSFVLIWCAEVFDSFKISYAKRLEEWVMLHPRFERGVRLMYANHREKEVRFLIFRAHVLYLRVRRFAREHQQAILALSGAALLAWMYVRSKKSPEALGNAIMREQVKPESMRVVGFDKKVSYEPVDARRWGKQVQEMNVAQLQTMNVGQGDLESMVRSQIVPAVIRVREGFKRSIHIFVLSSQWILVNKHYIFSDGKLVNTSFELEALGIVYRYQQHEWKYVDGREYFLVKNYFMPYAKSLDKFLATDIGMQSLDILCVMYDGTVAATAVHAYRKSEADGCVYHTIEWPHIGREGDCASIVLAKFKEGVCIVGFLFYRAPVIYLTSSQMMTGATLLLADDIKMVDASEDFPKVCDVLLGMPQVQDLAREAEVRNTVSGYLIPVGTRKGASRSFHTRIKKSRFYDDVAPLLSQEMGPPSKIRGLTDSGEYSSAFITTMKNINMHNFSDEGLRRKAMRAYLTDCLTEADGVDLRPLTLEEAIFGFPEMGIDRVVFKTSVGRRLREMGVSNKHDLFRECEDDTYELLPEFRDSVAELIDSLENGELPSVDVDFTPKDEVRPKSKLDKYKVRLFAVSDFHYNVVLRMYLMPLLTYLVDHPFASECFGQMNAGSREWTNLARYLTAFGINVFDMDFSCFDMSHGIPMNWIVAEFFYLLGLALGYPERQARMAYFLVRCLNVQVLMYFLDIIIKTKGMPSGVIITLIFNSIVNSILMRMAFIVLVVIFTVEEFRLHVHPATVGDDNACGLAADVSEVFNMITIARLYEQWGYVATPASKSGVLKKYMSLEEVTFVKRRFVWSNEFSLYLAPLEWDSVLKPLCFEEEEPGISSSQRLAQVAGGCQREAFLHGRVKFDYMQSLLAGLFKKHQMVNLELLQYDDLSKQLTEGSFRTFAC